MRPFTPQPLSDGLVLRSATTNDADRLAHFNVKTHSDDPDSPEEGLAVWTRDLLTRPHPTFSPELTTIVEDPANGEIVSSALLIPQTWTFAGIPFGVGRPELIGTHPDYRGRGLIRAQMEVLHRWSTELGHRMQAITGIPWFYRQFGYDMALELGGGRIGFDTTLPKAASFESGGVSFRPATDGDLEALASIYTDATSQELLACARTPELWHYEVSGKSEDNINRLEIRVIETPEKRILGFVAHPPWLIHKKMELFHTGIAHGESWQAIAPALLRYLASTGEGYAQKTGEACEGVYLSLGSTHPLFDLFPDWLPQVRQTYAWYIRIPDLQDFLRLIAPALEMRLAASTLQGFTKTVKLNFYRRGLILNFKSGILASVETWQPDTENYGDARFPDHTFLSLLCGRKSFGELRDFLPDCSAGTETAALLEALFPKSYSNVWPIS